MSARAAKHWTVLEGVAALAGLGTLLSGLLRYVRMRFRGDEAPLAERIDALLPQTQCGQCSYAGCLPYAEAIARGEADINQCPPGGDAGVAALAKLLDRELKPINPDYGEPKTEMTVAWIDEDVCIGCTKCIQACPVDAILGARQFMHTVIRDECTGCELCLDPCPVDCIHMWTIEPQPAAQRWPLFHSTQGKTAKHARQRADHARRRYKARQIRLGREAEARRQQREHKKAALHERANRSKSHASSHTSSHDDKKAAIAAALAKRRARQTGSTKHNPGE